MRTNALTCAAALLGLLAAGPAFARADGPDILIRDGTIVATAADYAMDGTMWTAFTRLEDSATWVYRSTDHGLSWEYRASLRCGAGMVEKLGLVVGEGDSAFAHVFYLDPAENGNLWELRVSCVNDSIEVFPVCTGPDTIRDFAVCRDYSGSNYWLYAVATNPDPPANNRALRFLRSSTYGREWAVTDSYTVQVFDPNIAFGAGSWCLLTGVMPLWMGGSVLTWLNHSWCSAGNWTYGYFLSDSDEVADPVIAPAFTLPESLAAVWCVYSQNFNNTGDWDVKCCYSTDGGSYWSQPEYLAGSTSADEEYPDLRNYTSPGNQYVNASYISDDNVYRSVYRRHAQAANPAQWSDTLRINQGNAGTGSEVRPKLCYTPGGPFTGAGCVFIGAGLNGCWWNAPYPSGVESPEPTVAVTRLDVRPSIGRAPFHIRAASPASLSIRDRVGRLVRSLEADRSGNTDWDGRDELGRLVPNGVYFCRLAAGDYTGTEKLVLQR